MTVQPQPYMRVPLNSLNYMWARGRPKLPYIPEVPVMVKHSQLTQVRAKVNGVVLPGDPGGNEDDRDTLLTPWYGKLGQVGSPYPITGPTKDQVGLSVPFSDLTIGPYPITQDSVSITSPVVWDKKIIHGRLAVTGAGKITATNCVFTGPANPDNTSLFTGETAVIDCDNAGVAQSLIKDCIIYMKKPHPRFNGHKGSRTKLERVHIFWVTDGLGPYTKPGQTFPTALECVGSRIERLVYWPGPKFADRTPNYWDGTAFVSGGTWTRAANGTTLDRAGYFDDVHQDGNHIDCIEIHNAFGSHSFNPTSKTWSGDGIHIWGNALICNDAFGLGNPSNIPISPLPLLGYGDSPRRGLLNGGQTPGMARPATTWTKPLPNGQYAGNGVSLYIGQVTNVAFGDPTSVVCDGNYLVGGNMGMQEQKKTLAFIPFVFHDNIFGTTQAAADFYRWSADNTRDTYAVRLNDYTTANAMPDFTSGPVRIPNHPVTGAPPFGAGASNRWTDGNPLLIGSSSLSGVRVI